MLSGRSSANSHGAPEPAQPVAVRAYVGLGANLGDPAAQIEAALAAIAALPGVVLVRRSSLYRSAPLGPPGQPDYCNAVCAIDTSLEPPALLAALQSIESATGRVRGAERWSARTLDLDLLHVEGVAIDSPALSLPHPELHRRAFVVVPLAEIAPELRIPRHGSVAALTATIDRTGLANWS